MVEKKKMIVKKKKLLMVKKMIVKKKQKKLIVKNKKLLMVKKMMVKKKKKKLIVKKKLLMVKKMTVKKEVIIVENNNSYRFMQSKLSDLVDNLSEINKKECKKYISRENIKSECDFIGFKNNRLNCRCKKCGKICYKSIKWINQ